MMIPMKSSTTPIIKRATLVEGGADPLPIKVKDDSLPFVVLN